MNDAPKALLVTLQPPGVGDHTAQSHLDELTGLVSTMGIEETRGLVVKHREPHPKLLVGTGKADEIVALAQDFGATLVIFDDDLSPSQQRNWEEMSGLTVIDRQEVILEIFSERAFTREAVLQVGLARMQYSLPRLARSYTNLSRQRGGARGNRGGGEMQLELDRRVILDKIDKLKEELEKVRRHRDRTRSKREGNTLPVASIVGYTNAGKSTLLNTFTDAGVLQEDKLFATLDPTTRRTALGGGLEILLTDTVGFIQKLPHHLVDAFRSTLEEAQFSDFLVHVVDASHPDWDVQRKTTLEVLSSLGCGDKPQLLVFNKIDALGGNEVLLRGLEIQFPGAVFVSLKTGEGVEGLKQALADTLKNLRRPVLYRLPLSRGDLVGYLYKHTQVLRETYTDSAIEITALAPPSAAAALAEFAAQEALT
jgi:GTP-binding protein HflX